MSALDELLARLDRLDVKIEAADGQLRIDAPKGVIDAPLKQALIQHKTDLLARLHPQGGDIQPAPTGAAAPLTAGQDRLHKLIGMHGDQSIYAVPMVYRLRGPLDVARLIRCLDRIQSRHAILRTRIFTEGGSVWQQGADPGPFAPVTDDLTQVPEAAQPAAVARLLEAERRQPFDLGTPPLWRCRVLVLSPELHVLIFTMHHIIFDLSSKTLFLRELETHYAGRTPQDLPIGFADYAHWSAGAAQQRRAAAQLDYWAAQLDGAAVELLLPTDHPRPTVSKMSGASHPISASQEVTGRLSALGRATGATTYMMLLAAFHALLFRYTGQTDQILCSPMAGRNHRQLEGLIGYFNNILPMRTDLSGDPSFRALLQRVRRVTLDAMKNQEAPFAQITQVPGLLGTPLTRGMFNYRGEDTTALALEGLVSEQLASDRPQADFDLALYLGIENGRIAGTLDYNAEIFRPRTIASMAEGLLAILETVTSDPDLPLSALPDLRPRFADIEAALRAHPKVEDAVVTLRSDARGGNRVAYLVLNEDDIPSRDEVQAVLDARHDVQTGPLLFVTVDTLPTLATGGVDVGALPAPSLSRTVLGRAYVAPRTPLEEKLAEIWQRVLWLSEKVGIHDNFFDLGGHSLLSVQMILDVEETLGLTVPLGRFGQLGTIAELAEALRHPDHAAEQPAGSALNPDILHQLQTYTAAWEGDRHRPDALIVGRNTSGRKRPVYWVVQRYMNLEKLAEYLGPDQPVYGLRSGHKVMGYGQDDIQDLAHHYVDEILEIHPAGPLVIGGICQASEIAFEIALRLRELGHEVSLLCLQERFVRKDYPGRIAFLFGDASDRNPHYHFARPELGWRKFYTGPIDKYIVRGKHGTFFLEDHVQVLTEKMRQAFEAAALPDAVDAPDVPALQILPAAAYRAKIFGPGPVHVEDGRARISVLVENASPVTWQPSDQSGVYLGARWVNPDARDTKGHDRFVHCTQARAQIGTALAPGARIPLALEATLPEDPGLRGLDVDLVDEGITWFADAGSEALRLEIQACGE